MKKISRLPLLTLGIVFLTTVASSDALAQRRGGTPARASAWERPPLEVSATYGHMWGGNISFPTGRIRTGTGPSLGLALDIPLHPQATLELSYTRQDGSLDLDQRGITTLTDWSVNFWHIGVIRNLMPPGKVVPFTTVSIGATYFSPKEGTFEFEGDTYQLESSTKLSFMFGLGAKAYFGEAERFGLRGSFKVLPTLYNTGAGIFVGTGGLSAGISGNAIWQWEVALGLTVKLGG